MSYSPREIIKTFGPIIHISADEDQLIALGQRYLHGFRRASPGGDLERWDGEVRWRWYFTAISGPEIDPYALQHIRDLARKGKRAIRRRQSARVEESS